MKLKQLFLLIAIFYTAIVVYYSLVTEEEMEPLLGDVLKIKGGFYVHLLAYLVMAVLWRGAGYAMLTSLVLAVAIGGSLEFAQLFMPFRSASVMDFLANSLGGFAGGMVVSLVNRKLK
jgi:VanZ family protein